MDQDFIQKMKGSLEELKNEIIDKLKVGSEDFREIVDGIEAKDEVDKASDDIDRKMLETLGAQDLKRMRLIDSALTRIEQGKYGLCMKCNKKIPTERLEAIPYALMCIECKTGDERRNR